MLLVGLGVSGTVTSQFDVYLPQGTFARYLDRREGFKILLSNDLYVSCLKLLPTMYRVFELDMLYFKHLLGHQKCTFKVIKTESVHS